MQTETISPTITMANDRDNGIDSNQFQSSTLNPTDSSTINLNCVLTTTGQETRSGLPAMENKIPFIGDVHEDDGFTSSWIFPTAALTKSKSSQDIPFVPPPTVEENGGRMMNDVPLDGSYVGGKKVINNFRAVLTKEKDIPFVPPEVESNEGSGGDAATAIPAGLTPQEGSFITDRKSPIAKGASNHDSRDIDFAPAGCGMETAAPPMDGSFSEGKAVSRLINTSNHDIDVVPDLAGKDMPTSPPPKQGTFAGRSAIDQAMSIQEIVVTRTDREINFSPGACEMTTGPPPFSGSYKQGQPISPIPRTTEIHVLPEDIGESLVVTPPRPGQYVTRIIDEDQGTSPTSTKDPAGHRSTQETIRPVPPVDFNESWVFPQLQQDQQEEIIFSAGEIELERPVSPDQGSFSENRHRNSLQDRSTHREIHVIPDLTGKYMPTSSPPKDGSFSGNLDYAIEGNEVPAADNVPSEGKQQSRDETSGEMNIDSQGSFEEHVTTPRDLALPNCNDRVTEPTKANVDEDDNEEEDDPMKDDQELWISKRAWESAKLKQKSVHALEQGDESTILSVPSTDDFGGQVIISGESLDSNPIAHSIHKLGALFGSAYEMKPVDSHDEETDMSNSIQKLGALLGSTHLDDTAHDNHTEPLHEATTSDQLDDLLGDNGDVVADVQGEISHSDSIVDLCPLPEFNKRSDSKVHDDDVTVQIENTTKQRQLQQTEGGKTLSLDMIHPSLPNELGIPVDNPDDYLPGDEMVKLEALLQNELDTSLKDFGKSNHDKAIDEAFKSSPTNEVQVGDDSYVPNASIARLEALLDDALDSPLETTQRSKNPKLAKTNNDDYSVNSLDDFLDKALDSDVEITFEPIEDEATAPLKNLPAVVEKPRVVANPQQAAASRSRFGVLSVGVGRNSKSGARVDQSKTAQDPPPSKKPVFPKFRGVPKTLTQAEKLTKTAQQRGKAVPNHDKGNSVKGPSISARDGKLATNSQNQAALTRTRLIISRFRPWTKRTTDSAKATGDDCQVQMFTPAESRNKGRATPIRLFATTNDSAKRKTDDVSSKSMKPKFPATDNKKAPRSDDRPSNETARIQQTIHLTNMAALPKKRGDDFYALSSLARSTSSLSSTCSVTHFRSPRREGIRGCQHKFDPYLHDVRGPCELCVFFLSDQDRAALDAHGRHIRVMFTTGGCGRTCAIFPRSFDDQPARLCRMCYSNSHRILQDRKSSKRGEQGSLPVHAENLSHHDESSSDMFLAF